MSKRNTQEEAMSRLFRSVQKKPTAPDKEAKSKTPKSEAPKGAPAKPKTQREKPTPKATKPKPKAVPKAKPVVGSDAAGAEHERIAPYIRPDQAMALRMAEATKRDPRGRTVSAIIRQLLDEAGYNSTYRPTF